LPCKSVELSLRDVPRTSLSYTINLAARLVSPKVGIIKSMGHGIYRAQDPQCLVLGIEAPDLARVSNITNTNKAGGAGESLERALAATIGEAIERYCMLFYDKGDMVFGSYREVQEEAVHPDLLRLYSEEQARTAGASTRMDYFTEDSRIYWVRGFSLMRKQPRLLPASLVYLAYEFDRDEAAIGVNASTGLAAGATIEEAVLSGLYECVERDAFTISWLCRWPGRRILVDDPGLLRRMKRHFHFGRPRVEIGFFDITLDIPIPCFFSYMLRPSELGPTLSVASVSRMNPQDSVEKCLNEMAQFLPYFRYLSAQMRDWTPKQDYSDLRTFDHHCMLYGKCPELIAPATAPYRELREEIALSALANYGCRRSLLSEIQEALTLLEARGFEVIVVDITTPDIEEVGLKVVRVLVPGLVNLHGDQLPFLGAARLHDMNRKLNPEVRELQMNPYPHPFP